MMLVDRYIQSPSFRQSALLFAAIIVLSLVATAALTLAINGALDALKNRQDASYDCPRLVKDFNENRDQHGKGLKIPRMTCSNFPITPGVYIRRLSPSLARFSLARNDTAGHLSISGFCVEVDLEPVGLVGTMRRNGNLYLFVSEQCGPKKDSASMAPMRLYPMATGHSAVLGIDIFQNYSVQIFDQSLSHVLAARLGQHLMSSEGEAADLRFEASDKLAEALLDLDDNRAFLNSVFWKSSLNTIYHQIIYFLFFVGMIGCLLVYLSIISSSRIRIDVDLESARSRLKIFSDILDYLPTVGLLGTMIGLMSTLFYFLGRFSADPTQASVYNSAALGGIILALTTTIVASLLLLFGKGLMVPTLDAVTVSKYDLDEALARIAEST